eukprot:855052_1
MGNNLLQLEIFPSSVTLNPTGASQETTTNNPTLAVTNVPSHFLTNSPTKNPTLAPIRLSSSIPTLTPTEMASHFPTSSPTKVPTLAPIQLSSSIPTLTTTEMASRFPSQVPSQFPIKTDVPTQTHTTSDDATVEPTTSHDITITSTTIDGQPSQPSQSSGSEDEHENEIVHKSKFEVKYLLVSVIAAFILVVIMIIYCVKWRNINRRTLINSIQMGAKQRGTVSADDHTNNVECQARKTTHTTDGETNTAPERKRSGSMDVDDINVMDVVLQNNSYQSEDREGVNKMSISSNLVGVTAEGDVQMNIDTIHEVDNDWA